MTVSLSLIPHFSIYKEESARRRFFIEKPPVGTTQHSVLHPDFWKAHTDFLKPNDIITVFCESDDGEPQQWEVAVTVESVSRTGIEVSFRERHPRKQDKSTVKHLDDGAVIRWAQPSDNLRETGYAVFNNQGRATSIMGCNTINEAYQRWDREKPRKIA